MGEQRQRCGRCDTDPAKCKPILGSKALFTSITIYLLYLNTSLWTDHFRDVIQGRMIFPTYTTLSSGFMNSIFLRLLCGLWLRLTCSPFSRAEVVLKGGYGFIMDSYIFKKWLYSWNRHKSKIELQSWRIRQANVSCLMFNPSIPALRYLRAIMCNIICSRLGCRYIAV